MQQSYKKYDIQEAREAIMRYCAYQERSQSEVKKKLEQMGLIPMVIDLLMVELIENNYVNELRFAETFASGKFRIKGWGRMKIKDRLRLKNVSQPCIDIALAGIDDEEYMSQLRRIAEWKYPKIKDNNPYTRKQKLIGFLFSRGFEYELVREVVEEVFQ
ncbi:MAG: regulatory protein RecX [Cryomorphaceae bacterium]|nr:regulatory protein RecX [Cryomorphaceae bacterium]